MIDIFAATGTENIKDQIVSEHPLIEYIRLFGQLGSLSCLKMKG